jgi:hydroxymethylpyrimidine kinase/phosphomethylpyrimidine kinase
MVISFQRIRSIQGKKRDGMTAREPSAKTAFTIAGHDGSNGAGITKDLEVFASLGLFGLSAPTAFVIQGPRGVTAVRPVEVSVLSEVLQEAEMGFTIRGIKIGIIPQREHVETIADFVARHGDAFVVLDPVFAAKNGTRVTTGEAVMAMRERLLPLVDCITPNLDEAGILVGREIVDDAGMEQAAREVVRMGPKSAVIKGGHLDSDPIDVLCDGNEITRFRRKRIGKTVHGTGCIYSSALLSFCVQGHTLKEAFFAAEEIVGALIEESFQPQEDGYYYASPGIKGSAVLEALRPKLTT